MGNLFKTIAGWLLALSLLTLNSEHLFAQSIQKVNPIPTAEDFWGVTIHNGLITAVGDDRMIAQNFFSGNIFDWDVQSLTGIDWRLFSVTTNGNLTVAGGGNGSIVFFESGVWQNRTISFGENHIRGIVILPNGRVVGCAGPFVFHTDDNGLSWVVRDPIFNNSDRYYSLASDGGNVVIAAGEGGTIVRSENAAQTWAAANSVPTEKYIWSLAYLQGGIVVGGSQGEIIRSHDAGKNWELIADIPTSSNIDGLAASPDGKIVVGVCENGDIIRSEDAGLTWTKTSSELAPYLTGVAFDQTNKSLAVVCASYGRIFKSDDAGLTWTAATRQITRQSLYTSHIFPDGKFVVAGRDGIYVNFDNPDRYHVSKLGDDHIYDIHINDDVQLVVGRGLPLKIVGSDTTYLGVPNLTRGESCFVLSPDTMFIGGDSYLYGSFDGGNKWEKLHRQRSSYEVDDIDFKSGVGLAIDGRRVIKTRDGRTWEELSRVPRNAYIFDLAVIDENNYLAGGNYGVHKTSDGGRTWRTVLNTDGYNIRAVESHGAFALATTLSSVYASQDAGETWEKILSNTYGLVDISITEGHAVIVGWGGTIYYYQGSTTTVESERSGLPTGFKLAQNYPNPFNPETTIRFALPEAGHVKLAIYDVLGRSVATLVDKVHSAGSYSVRWNGRNDAGGSLTSGMYFYRISVGSFTTTKRMLLMK